MTDASHLPAAIFGTVSLGTVLDNLESVLAGEREDRLHVAGHAGKMHTDDGAGLFCQFCPNGCGGNVL